MKIESKIGTSTSDDKQIFEFITDFNNFKSLLPEGKVSNWESTQDSCSFRVDPVGSIGLEIIEKSPHSLVKIASKPDFSTYQFTIWIQLKSVAENDTRIKITIEPLVNKMLLPMIKSPLKQFVDGLIDQIQNHDFG